MDTAITGIIGVWTVRFKHWRWEYTFTADGRVKWRDPLNGMTGTGRFGKAPKVIFFTWDASPTKESWNLPISDQMSGWINAQYGTGPLTATKNAAAPASPSPPAATPTDAQLIAAAFAESRAALRAALARLRALRQTIGALNSTHGPNRITQEQFLLSYFRRDIAVLNKRLLLTDPPTSQNFSSALDKTIELLDANLALPNSIQLTRNTGFCSNPAFAWTTVGVKPPNTELCTAWLSASAALKRDVITHEYFHTIGLFDISVNNTTDALRNANTMAQVVAFLADRNRQANSDGNEAAAPPLPSP